MNSKRNTGIYQHEDTRSKQSGSDYSGTGTRKKPPLRRSKRQINKSQTKNSKYRSPRHFTAALRLRVGEFFKYLDSHRKIKLMLGDSINYEWQTALLTFINDADGSNVTHDNLTLWMDKYPNVFKSPGEIESDSSSSSYDPSARIDSERKTVGGKNSQTKFTGNNGVNNEGIVMQGSSKGRGHIRNKGAAVEVQPDSQVVHSPTISSTQYQPPQTSSLPSGSTTIQQPQEKNAIGLHQLSQPFNQYSQNSQQRPLHPLSLLPSASTTAAHMQHSNRNEGSALDQLPQIVNSLPQQTYPGRILPSATAFVDSLTRVQTDSSTTGNGTRDVMLNQPTQTISNQPRQNHEQQRSDSFSMLPSVSNKPAQPLYSNWNSGTSESHGQLVHLFNNPPRQNSATLNQLNASNGSAEACLNQLPQPVTDFPVQNCQEQQFPLNSSCMPNVGRERTVSKTENAGLDRSLPPDLIVTLNINGLRPEAALTTTMGTPLVDNKGNFRQSFYIRNVNRASPALRPPQQAELFTTYEN